MDRENQSDEPTEGGMTWASAVADVQWRTYSGGRTVADVQWRDWSFNDVAPAFGNTVPGFFVGPLERDVDVVILCQERWHVNQAISDRKRLKVGFRYISRMISGHT